MNRTEEFAAVTRFHGHECPGSAVGLRLAEVAVSVLGRNGDTNKIVASGETDACAIDAVQVLTGCTYGKRNLIHEEQGKVAFTFWRASDGTGVRVSAKPGTDAYRDDDLWELARRVESGQATTLESIQFKDSQAARIKRILEAPAEELVLVEPVFSEPPGVKKLMPHAACEGCGEQTSIGTLHDHQGRQLCPACHLEAHDGVLPHEHGHGHGHGHGH